MNLRTLGFAGLVVLAGCDYVPPQVKNLLPDSLKPEANFELRGFTAATTLSQAKAKGLISTCIGNNTRFGDPSQVFCQMADETLAGIPARTTVVFAHDKLESIAIMLPTGAFDRAVQGLTSAYGSPCRSGNKETSMLIQGVQSDIPTERQNSDGSITFGGDIHVKKVGEALKWCFKDGEFRARRYSGPGESSFGFSRERSSEPKFSPKSL